MKIKKISLQLFLLLAITLSSFTFGFKAQAQDKSTYVSKVVLQAFWWDYWNSNYRYNWCSYITDLAPRLKSLGYDAVWVPPFIKNGSGGSVGYSPFDPYDLGDKYQKGGGDGIRDSTRCGTKDDLLRMIAVLHANGIEVICDAVLNHHDGAGSNSNAGGIDNHPLSLASNNGYKNFRYVSYKTPIIDDTKRGDYWSRSGRWSKNYTNFYPNANIGNNDGDIRAAYFGPDVDYETVAVPGQSSNIPTSGDTTINGITRPYHNPVQSADYMQNGVRDWMKWLKKQTAIDGYRFDAVKHFPFDVQSDVVRDAKYNLPSWASGGQDMFNIGEWVGGAGELDNYVYQVRLQDYANEEATGAFDFALRGYGTNGGLYSMVHGAGGFNMQFLQYDLQSKRWMDYGTKRVYRSTPFVNSHDTYRPLLNEATPGQIGNFLKPLGDNSGWNTGQELGGNGQHIDPRQPRLFAAYAAAIAFNGSPMVYFEDLFDIGTTGKRWSHMPQSETDLPVRKDIENLVLAHQKLQFKWGDQFFPTNYVGGTAPFYLSGSAGDHFVIERRGRAIIGVTDAFSSTTTNANDQQVWVNVADASWIGKALYDYSGAHGVTTSVVQPDGRVLIKTAPAGHNIAGARGHGYSIWAPAPPAVTFTTVQDIYNYLASYTPPRNPTTTQEWEMADDLGDSHCLGSGQGGALPTNASNERIAGRVFAKGGTLVSVVVTPEVNGRNLTFTLYDNNGLAVATVSGVAGTATPLTVSYTPSADGWLVAKVRNTNNVTAGQKCWVRLTYQAPAVVDTKAPVSLINTKISIWTGNKGTTNVFDCGNWEGGRIPGPASTVIVYGHATPFPILTSDLTVNKVNLYTGAQFTVNPGIKLNVEEYLP